MSRTAERPFALRDRRLADLVAALRDAGDEPIGYRELLAEGIADPAQRLYELELAGYGIERCHLVGGRTGVQTFRLVSEPRAASGGRRR